MKYYKATISFVFETDDDLTENEIEKLSAELFTHGGDFEPENMDIEVHSVETSTLKKTRKV